MAQLSAVGAPVSHVPILVRLVGQDKGDGSAVDKANTGEGVTAVVADGDEKAGAILCPYPAVLLGLVDWVAQSKAAEAKSVLKRRR